VVRQIEDRFNAPVRHSSSPFSMYSFFGIEPLLRPCPLRSILFYGFRDCGRSVLGVTVLLDRPQMVRGFGSRGDGGAGFGLSQSFWVIGLHVSPFRRRSSSWPVRYSPISSLNFRSRSHRTTNPRCSDSVQSGVFTSSCLSRLTKRIASRVASRSNGRRGISRFCRIRPARGHASPWREKAFNSGRRSKSNPHLIQHNLE
jgi:hypothetical protein